VKIMKDFARTLIGPTNPFISNEYLSSHRDSYQPSAAPASAAEQQSGCSHSRKRILKRGWLS
jgi:hypothetical protein